MYDQATTRIHPQFGHGHLGGIGRLYGSHIECQGSVCKVNLLSMYQTWSPNNERHRHCGNRTDKSYRRAAKLHVQQDTDNMQWIASHERRAARIKRHPRNHPNILLYPITSLTWTQSSTHPKLKGRGHDLDRHNTAAKP
jgi:hypothetical protein